MPAWNKAPWLWNYEDVARLVDLKVPESPTLDYKDSRALGPDHRLDLCRDISAFANTQGGTILYGVAADNKTGVPQVVDLGTDPREINVEWIGQVIQGGVHPRLEGLRIVDVPLESGRVLFIVHVAESTTVHMADGRYYRRYDRRSVPMGDPEVRALLDRAKTPKIATTLKFSVNGVGPNAVLTWEVSARNLRPTAADYFRVNVFVSDALRLINQIHFVQRGVRDVRMTRLGETLRMTWLTFDWFDRMPLFEGLEESVGSFLTDARYGERVYWCAQAPRMLTKGAYITTSENRTGLKAIAEAWDLLPLVEAPPPEPKSEVEQLIDDEIKQRAEQGGGGADWSA